MTEPKFALGELAIVCTPRGQVAGQCIVTMTPRDVLAPGTNGREHVRAGWYEIKVGKGFFQVQEYQLRKLPGYDGREVTTWDKCVWRPTTKSVLSPKKQIDVYQLPNLRNKPCSE